MGKFVKMYNVTGMMSRPGMMQVMPGEPLIITVTKEGKECTVSICNEEIDIQLTVPFMQVLEDLKRH